MPTTICRVAPSARIVIPFDPDAFDTEPAIVDLGYLWCERFNAGCLDGEYGHAQIARLLPLQRADFELVVVGLRAGCEDLVERCIAGVWSETDWPSPALASIP